MDDGVVEGEGGGAGACEDLFDEGLGSGEALAGGGDVDDGEVGGGVVPVAALLAGPAEEVEGEVGVGLGAEGGHDVGGGEAGAEVGDPGVELLLERGSGSRVRVGVWGFGVLGECGEVSDGGERGCFFGKGRKESAGDCFPHLLLSSSSLCL